MSAYNGMPSNWSADLVLREFPEFDWEAEPFRFLGETIVPVVASVYYDDVYVDRESSLETAALIPGIRTWITSGYAHNGLSADAKVLDHLIALRRGEI